MILGLPPPLKNQDSQKIKSRLPVLSGFDDIRDGHARRNPFHAAIINLISGKAVECFLRIGSPSPTGV
jgi:hypothetical protein